MSDRDYPTELSQLLAAEYVHALAKAVHTRDRCHVAYDQLPLKVGGATRLLVAALQDAGVLTPEEASLAHFEADSVREHGVVHLFCGSVVLELDLLTADVTTFDFHPAA